MVLRSLKDALKKEVGQEVLSKGEAFNLTKNLGCGYSSDAIAHRLRPCRIVLADYGIDPVHYKAGTNPTLYRAQDVLDFLQQLESKGQIRTISGLTIEGLLELDYHLPPYKRSSTRSQDGRVLPHAPSDDQSRYDLDE